MSEQAGTAVVDIVGNIAPLNASLSEAEQRTRQGVANISKQFTQLNSSLARSQTAVARIGTSFLGVATAMVVAGKAVQVFNASINNQAAMGALAQRTGIAVEQLSALKFAAEQSGVEFTTLQQTIQGFTQRILEGLADGTSRVSVAFRLLGVDARDSQGNVKQFDVLLPQLADKFARMTDGVQKAQLASAIFGEEAGPKLVPLLNQGSAGIQKLMDRARELGVTLDKDSVAKAQAFQRQLRELGSALEEVGREFTELSLNYGLTDFLKALAEVFRSLNTPLPATITDIGRLNAQIGITKKRLEELTNTTRTADGWTQFWKFPYVEAEIEKLSLQLAGLIAQRELLTKNQGTTGKGGQNTNVDLTKAMQQFELARANLDEFMERVEGSRTLFDQMNYQWISHAELVEQATQRINAAYGNTLDAQIRISQMKRSLALAEQRGMMDTATAAANAITALWPKQKGAAIAAAVINTAVAVTKALTSGIPPWNFATAALVGAAGAAQIAAIRSANPSGGGSIPSVSGGGTSVPTAPAEQQQTVPAGRAVTIYMPKGEFFSSDTMTKFIERLNEEVQNGAILISTKTSPA